MRVFIFLLLTTHYTLAGQTGFSYLVTLENDTLHFTSIKMANKMRMVRCEEKGKKSGYSAQEVRLVKIDDLAYESGYVRLKTLKRKRYYFLNKIISGPLSMYTITAESAGWTLTGWAKHK